MGKIVSIHSFRGGTGKSNVTANTSTQVAMRGYRVGVVDTDIQSPGIHVIFGLDDSQMNYSLNDYLWGKCDIQETAYSVGQYVMDGHNNSVKLAPGGEIFLIPSSIKAGEITRILRDGYDVGLLNEGFQDIIERLNLDYLFIDTHPGLNEETLLSIAISDLLLLILRPDNQDFQGTGVTVDVARKLGVPALSLVINKLLTSYDANAVRQTVADTFAAEVIAALPLSEDVAGNASSGVFSVMYPDHAWSRQIYAIVDRVLSL